MLMSSAFAVNELTVCRFTACRLSVRKFTACRLTFSVFNNLSLRFIGRLRLRSACGFAVPAPSSMASTGSLGARSSSKRSCNWQSVRSITARPVSSGRETTLPAWNAAARRGKRTLYRGILLLICCFASSKFIFIPHLFLNRGVCPRPNTLLCRKSRQNLYTLQYIVL
jgi:hypothetical protein